MLLRLLLHQSPGQRCQAGLLQQPPVCFNREESWAPTANAEQLVACRPAGSNDSERHSTWV